MYRRLVNTSRLGVDNRQRRDLTQAHPCGSSLRCAHAANAPSSSASSTDSKRQMGAVALGGRGRLDLRPSAEPSESVIWTIASSWSGCSVRFRWRVARVGGARPGRAPQALAPTTARRPPPWRAGVALVAARGSAAPGRGPPTAALLDQLDRLVREFEQAQQIRDRHPAAADPRPTSSRDRPSSSVSASQARASSTGLRSSRAMFSISASSSVVAVVSARTIAGIVSRPATAAARQRRSRRSARSGRRAAGDEDGLQDAPVLDRLRQRHQSPPRRNRRRG